MVLCAEECMCVCIYVYVCASRVGKERRGEERRGQKVDTMNGRAWCLCGRERERDASASARLHGQRIVGRAWSQHRSTARRNLAEVVTLFDARTQAGRRNLQSTAPNPQLCVESEQARRAGLRADKAVRRRGLELELELELALAVTTPAAAQVDASRESSARLTTSHRVSSCMEYGEECRRKGQGRPDKGGHGERTNTRGAGQS